MSTPAPAPFLTMLTAPAAPTAPTPPTAPGGTRLTAPPFAALLDSAMQSPELPVLPALKAPAAPLLTKPSLDDVDETPDAGLLLPGLELVSLDADQMPEAPQDQAQPLIPPATASQVAQAAPAMPLAAFDTMQAVPDTSAELAIDTAEPDGSPSLTTAIDTARARALAHAASAANPRAHAVAAGTPGPADAAWQALEAGQARPLVGLPGSGLPLAGNDSGSDMATPTPAGSSPAIVAATATAGASTQSLANTLPADAATGARYDAVLDAQADVHSDAFPDEIGARLSWLAERRLGHAQIRVAPPELGAVDVRLQVDGDRVRVDFSSPHAEVRAALEAGLPRLREQFEARGMALVQAEVGGQGDGREPSAQGYGGDMLDDADESAERMSLAPRQTRNGLLDEYA